MTVKDLKEKLETMPEDKIVKVVTEGLYRDYLSNTVTDCEEFKNFVGIKYE